MIKKIQLLIIASFPLIVFAGGFQINTQSIKAIGLGGAFTGLCNDASTVFMNPGAMGMLNKKLNVTVGDAFILPSTSYLSPYNGNIDMESQIFFPFQVYASYKIKKLAIGLSINNPYGLGTKWENDWEGRYITQEVNLKTFYFQPTLSYNLTENVGIGAGFVYATGDAIIKKAAQNTGTSDVIATLEGKGSGYGFNVGAFFKFGEKARIGIDYRSAVKVDLENGDATFSNVPSSLNETIPDEAKFNSGIKFPSTFSVGFSYDISKKVMFTADFNYTGWKSFDSLNFTFPDYPDLDSKNYRNYKNVIAVRTGVQYMISDKLPVRIGFAYDQSPVQDGYVSPDLPDANKIALTAGASYLISDKISIDLSYAFENFKERKASYDAQAFNGTYKTVISIIGLGVNFSF